MMDRGRKRPRSYIVRMVADAVPVGEAGQNRGREVRVPQRVFACGQHFHAKYYCAVVLRASSLSCPVHT